MESPMTRRIARVLAVCGIIFVSIVAQAGRAATASSAQSPSGRQKPAKPVVDRIGSGEIRSALGRVGLKVGGVVFPGSSDGQAQYILNRRRTPSEVEQHDEWDDILIFQTGYGAIHHGGEWRNSKGVYVGERRGGSLLAPTELTVGPGDVVRVPAGEPHRVVPRGDAPLVYLVVKTRRGDASK
jgi:mannose-6-phosphate isomerase-like protein (cupin superfamily)